MRRRTERLELIATTLAHVEAELAVPSGLPALLGVPLPEGWPPGEYDRDALEFFRAQLTAGGPEVVGWYGWYALTLTPSRALVAAGGFLGPPVEGRAELGFSVVPSARGHGYASELSEALVAFAFQSGRVRELVAHTSEENAASKGVLKRCGFTRSGVEAGIGVWLRGM